MSINNLLFLPKAGLDNPYQILSRAGVSFFLSSEKPIDSKFFPLTLNKLSKRKHNIHFDWIARYYLRRNSILTVFSIFFFVVDVSLYRLFGGKYYWTLHNITPHDFPVNGLYLFPRRYFAKHAEWIRVFSKESIPEASRVLRVSPSKFKVVPEGSYLGYYKDDMSRDAARELLGIDKDVFLFLHFGMVKPYKGVDVLLDSFKQIATSRVKLIIAGRILDGQLKEILAHPLPQVLVVDEFIPEDQVQVYMRAADCCVFPFHRIENSGSVILAMGFGLPVIVPNTPVMREKVSSTGGFLFEHPDELPSLMEKASSMNSDELSQMGNRNLAYAQGLNWSDFGKLFQE